MNNAVVSIIIPCYNGGKWVSRLLESVLIQTYDKIELIIVDDGSTDSSAQIIKGFEKAFLQKGYIFMYIYQENQGLGGAIDTGLKHFTGEFLCWCDADDYLEPDSITERINFLVSHPEYAVVTSDAFVRNSDDLEHHKALISNGRMHLNDKRQFEYLLKEDGIFCSGCHMVRADAFLQVNPDRSIYPARRGQNWQMLLPIYYKFDAYFLNKPLYNYIDYPTSMSKDKKTLESYLLRYNEHLEILINTLEMIENVQHTDLSKYKLFVKKKYSYLKMNISLRYFNYKNFDIEFKVKKQYGIEKRDIIALVRRYIKPVNHLFLKIK